MTDNVVNLDHAREAHAAPLSGAVALLGDQPHVETVPQLQPIQLPLEKLRAVLLCAASDATRYYLNGVFIHRTPDNYVRAVATDGHRLMVANLYREYADQPGPKWLDGGVIVPADGLAARLALVAKTHGKSELPVTIAYAEGSAKIEVSDDYDRDTFRLSPVDGSFPDYSQITGSWSGEEQARGDWAPTGFNPAYLKSVSDIAKRLGAKSVECYAPSTRGKDSQGPALFTFSGVGGVALFLMPMRTTEEVAEDTRALLAPSIKLTLAALKAHETRQRKAAKKAAGAERAAALAKADEFKARIEALVARVGTGDVSAALPAPVAPQPEPPVEIGDALASDADQLADTSDTESQEQQGDEPAQREEQEPVEQQPDAPAETTRRRRGGSKDRKNRKA